MSRQPSWASFTRPINATSVATKPAPPAGVYHPLYNQAFPQAIGGAAPAYPVAGAMMPPALPGFAAPQQPVADRDASIRGLLADILGGGDGTNAQPIPAPQPPSVQPAQSLHPAHYYPFHPNPSGFYPPSSSYPPSSQVPAPPHNAAGYPTTQFPPRASQLAPNHPESAQPFVFPQQKGRQLITLSGPNAVNNNNNGIIVPNNVNNNNGVYPYPQHQQLQQQQHQQQRQRQSSPSQNAATNGDSLHPQANGSTLRAGVKRKPTDDTPAAAAAAPTNAVHPPPPPPSDEEYKKSTKHFLYHCDVCNFTCQGPGIYYHIVSPKHKTCCQKQGRVFIEPKGVLVGSRGPKRDRGTGQDYQSLGGGEKHHHHAGGVDPLEDDEGPYVEFYNFCKSLQIPLDLIPSGDELANLRLPTAEPEQKNAQLAKLVSSIRASAAEQEETNKTTSRNFRYWVSTFKEQQKEKEMKKILAIKGAEPFHFKVVNYNVLAQAMMTEQSYNFQQHKPDHLEFEHRSKCIQEEIDYIGDPEIICLQEVASDVYSSFFVPLLEMRGYLGVFRCRQSGVAEGCAIFVRLDKFRFVDAQPLSLKRDVPILDRENVGLMLKVKPIVPRPKNVSVEKWREPDSHLCIVTTQLIFSAQRGDTKLAQLGLLFAEMDKFCRKSGSESYHPTIFCGDMNALPYSHLYKFIQGKRLKYSGLQADEVSGQTNMFTKERKHFLAKPLFPPQVGITENCQFGDVDGLAPTGELTHSFKFVTVYKHEIAARERDPNDEGEIEIKTIDNREISTQIKGFSTCTDYMFYSVDGFRVSHNIQTGRMIPQDVLEGPLRIIARHRIPVMSEMKDVGLIPNATDGSDHFPLAAEFLLNPWTFTRS